jgi:short-subunit dehydrogenase
MDNGKNKLAVITGASSGIGYELARVFARNGFDLLLAADGPGIDDAARDVGALGVSAEAVRVDLASAEGVQRLFDRIRSAGRPVDALVLNAGVGVNGRFVDEISLEEDLNLVRLNVTSVVHLAKLMLPAMVERGEGRVLVTSSIAALMPGPFYATYAASKAFLLSFSEALHNELQDSGVTVTALMPGATDTNFFARAGMEDTKVGQAEKDDPAEVAQEGFDAMMAGKDHVVAGSFKNKLQSFASRFLSEQQRAALHRSEIEPGSAA